LLLTALMSCQTTADDPQDLSKSWEYGAISIPASAFADKQKLEGSIDFVLPSVAGANKPGAKRPVVVLPTVARTWAVKAASL